MSAGSSQDLLVDLYKITQGPPTRTSTRPWSRSSYMTHHETLARKNHKISLAGSKSASKNSHWATIRAIWRAQSAERFARAMAKFAAHHDESDPIRTKCRKGCKRVARAISKFALRTVPQGGASRHAQSDEKVARFSHWFIRRGLQSIAQGKHSCTLCASLCSRNAHGHLTREVARELAAKIPRPWERTLI